MIEIMEDGKTYIVSGNYPDGNFTKYLKSDPTPVRKISQAAFLDRFNATEQIIAHASADPVVKTFLTNAIGVQRPYINLDHPMIQEAMPYLVEQSILDGDTAEERTSRAAVILRDGEEGEK